MKNERLERLGQSGMKIAEDTRSFLSTPNSAEPSLEERSSEEPLLSLPKNHHWKIPLMNQ